MNNKCEYDINIAKLLKKCNIKSYFHFKLLNNYIDRIIKFTYELMLFYFITAKQFTKKHMKMLPIPKYV